MLRCRTIGHAALFAAALLLVGAPPAHATDPAIGAGCSPQRGNSARYDNGNNSWCNGSTWQYPAYQFGSTALGCTTTQAGMIQWTGSVMEYCNGSAWTQFEPVQSTPVITAPAGSGYFVLSAGTYTGNLGGRGGANAKCLTELTTNTGWQGYATANSNGQLVAAKVHAWLCDTVACSDLMPLTTYYFANAGNSSAGGGFFTTDSSGLGPGDNNNWSAANYFSGTSNYWTGRTAGSSTVWGNFNSNGNNNCIAFSNGTNSATGIFAVSTNTTSGRWDSAAVGCAGTMNLICYVDP